MRSLVADQIRRIVCGYCGQCGTDICKAHIARCEAMYLEEAEAIVKLIDTSIQPPEGTKRYKFCEWFCNNINFCMGTYYNGVDKSENSVYEFFYKYWLFPFKQTGCACCNTVRGLIYGAAIGFFLGLLC